MANVSIAELLVEIQDRATKRPRPSSTVLELSEALGVAEDDARGLINEALEQGWVERDPQYEGYFRLTVDGQQALDSRLFS